MENINPIEKELNLLNFLVVKEDIKEETISLIAEYPNVIKAFPILLAIRENSLEVLIDTKKFIYQKFNFNQRVLSQDEIASLADFLINSGFADIIKNKKIKNIVDYAIGVEVGLDSNGRKNRGGKLMEALVEDFVKETSDDLNIMNEYWNEQGIKFIWITDGAGWQTALKPLREYFDNAEYLINLEMLQKGILTKVISNS